MSSAGAQTRPATLGAELERLRTEVMPSWVELGASPELVDGLPPLAAVAQHNDLGAWNVVAHGDDFVVLDWENVRLAALPLWDLLYFLGNALVLLDGPYTPEELPARMAHPFAGETPASALLFSWIRRGAEAAAYRSTRSRRSRRSAG